MIEMIKPQSSKAKGRRLQQDVAALVRKHFPVLTQRDVFSTSMGKTGSDVELSEKAYELFPYCVECKSRKSVGIYSDYEQAKSHGNGEPLLVIKQDRSRPLAVVDLEHFFELVEKARG